MNNANGAIIHVVCTLEILKAIIKETWQHLVNEKKAYLYNAASSCSKQFVKIFKVVVEESFKEKGYRAGEIGMHTASKFKFKNETKSPKRKGA